LIQQNEARGREVAGFCFGGGAELEALEVLERLDWVEKARGARGARIAREGTKDFLVTSMLHDLGRRGIIQNGVIYKI
jgi:hypothetical protein